MHKREIEVEGNVVGHDDTATHLCEPSGVVYRMGRLSAYSYTLSRVIRQEKKAVITRILLLYCHFLTERCYGVSLPVFSYRVCFAAGYVTQ